MEIAVENGREARDLRPHDTERGDLPMHDHCSLQDNLWARVKKTSTCWLWTGRSNHNYRVDGGYGLIWADGHHHLVHRLSYEWEYGALPAGMEVCHRCDVPTCVRPSHLFLATHQENMADAAQKGRMRTGGFPPPLKRGEDNGHAVLSELSVRNLWQEIKDRKSRRLLAAKYAVSLSSVHSIAEGRNWGWLTKSL